MGAVARRPDTHDGSAPEAADQTLAVHFLCPILCPQSLKAAHNASQSITRSVLFSVSRLWAYFSENEHLISLDHYSSQPCIRRAKSRFLGLLTEGLQVRVLPEEPVCF